MAPQGSQKETNRPEKISEDIRAENLPNTRKETLKPKKHSLIQNKPQEEKNETYINQTEKN